MVVICLKIHIFAVVETTWVERWTVVVICLKIHIFAVVETTLSQKAIYCQSCDLLKNSYICSS